ncbi:lysophospholipase, partial [Enterobacter mori]
TNYANIPYIMIGHSMGSIVGRIFAQKYPDAAQGLILTGTIQYPIYLGVPLRILLKVIMLLTGKTRRLKWANQLMYKTFNKNV